MIVYVFTVKGIYQPIKIGHSKDFDSMEQRLRDLQTGSPAILACSMYFLCDGKLTHLELEKFFHKWLRSCQLHGEWFDCSIGDFKRFYGLLRKFDKNIRNNTKKINYHIYHSEEIDNNHSQEMAKLM